MKYVPSHVEHKGEIIAICNPDDRDWKNKLFVISNEFGYLRGVFAGCAQEAFDIAAGDLQYAGIVEVSLD